MDDPELVHGGGTLELGGALAGGAFAQPTIVRAPADLPVMQHETFGPLLYLVPIDSIEGFLQLGKKKKIGVVRTMPNTPAVVLEGVTALSAGKHVSKSEMQVAHRIFEAIGKTVDVAEVHMDAVTGLSGSGPAYIFTIIEALSDAGVKVGLSRDVADALALQTVVGSARLAQETGKHPGELKNMVTSPGGTTIYGIHALEEGGLRGILIDAVEKATRRSRELGQQAADAENKNGKKSR